jgi:agmatinase
MVPRVKRGVRDLAPMPCRHDYMKRPRKTSAVFFPFDLFGSGGTAAGVSLLADELREILADNRREKVPTRADCYSPHVRLEEPTFETLDALADWRECGRQLARAALKRGDFLVWASGNHLGVLPVYDELAGDGGTVVVQFDAHLDIHHFDDCTEELSHGNFLLHCAGPLPRLVNVGHRDLLLPEEHIARTFHAAIPATRLAIDPAGVIAELRRLTEKAERVFLDLDCDVFDPAFFPAVGQPVPFGPAPAAVLALIDAIWSERVAGLFVSEFDPARDCEDRSLATLMWLVEYLLVRRYEG